VIILYITIAYGLLPGSNNVFFLVYIFLFLSAGFGIKSLTMKSKNRIIKWIAIFALAVPALTYILFNIITIIAFIQLPSMLAQLQ